MAEIIQNTASKGKHRQRSNIHIDMTPMVDLGFLLITFFIMITTFQKENIMDLGLPAKSLLPINNQIDVKNQLTFILGDQNKVYYYQKEAKNLNVSDLQSVSEKEIPKIIDQYRRNALDQEKFTVIIKPTNDSNYQNFVDMLDHLAVGKNERYGITDLRPNEKLIYEQILQ